MHVEMTRNPQKCKTAIVSAKRLVFLDRNSPMGLWRWMLDFYPVSARTNGRDGGLSNPLSGGRFVSGFPLGRGPRRRTPSAPANHTHPISTGHCHSSCARPLHAHGATGGTEPRHLRVPPLCARAKCMQGFLKPAWEFRCGKSVRPRRLPPTARPRPQARHDKHPNL
jgi:hypothetical protein